MDNLYTVDILAGPNVSFIERSHCNCIGCDSKLFMMVEKVKNQGDFERRSNCITNIICTQYVNTYIQQITYTDIINTAHVS